MGFSFELTGRTALITGASSGLGTRFGRILAASGANVALGARRADRLAALASEIGAQAAAVQMDVAREADIIAGFDAAEAAFGPVDTVIANAGVDGAGMATTISEEEIEQMVRDAEANAAAPAPAAAPAYPDLRSQVQELEAQLTTVRSELGTAAELEVFLSRPEAVAFQELLASDPLQRLYVCIRPGRQSQGWLARAGPRSAGTPCLRQS